MIEKIGQMIEEDKVNAIGVVTNMVRNLTIEDLRSVKLQDAMTGLKNLLDDYNKVFERLRI